MNPAAIDDARREHRRAVRARHYAKHAERYRAKSKAWRAANPDKVKANNAKRYRAKGAEVRAKRNARYRE